MQFTEDKEGSFYIMNNLKNKIKNMKGITLISLVITIVVLLILAGVTINIAIRRKWIV